MWRGWEMTGSVHGGLGFVESEDVFRGMGWGQIMGRFEVPAREIEMRKLDINRQNKYS